MFKSNQKRSASKQHKQPKIAKKSTQCSTLRKTISTPSRRSLLTTRKASKKASIPHISINTNNINTLTQQNSPQKKQTLPKFQSLRCFSTTPPIDTPTTTTVVLNNDTLVPPDTTLDFYKLDLRVARLDNIRDHPNADSLYILDCHVGEEQPRQVVTNVKPYMSVESLTNRKQVVITNLKPVKFRGEASFAMFLGGSDEAQTQNGLAIPRYQPGKKSADLSNDELNTIKDSINTTFLEGTRLFLSGESPIVGEIPRINDKNLAKVLQDLSTDNDGNVTYKGKQVVYGNPSNPYTVGFDIPNAKIF